MKFYNTIFAAPVLELDIKINNKKIIKALKQMQKQNPGRVISNAGGWQRENLDPKLDIFKPLTKHIIEASIEFAKNCKFKHGKYSISNLWANINNYRDYNDLHIHQHAMISGVYYLKAPKNCGNLVLRHPSQCIEYDWSKNKGYPTKTHRLAISTHGKTEYHRNSFKLLPDQYEILFN